MTNFEKIKAMDVEEMAEFIDGPECMCCSFWDNEMRGCNWEIADCKIGVLKWLESEVEE